MNNSEIRESEVIVNAEVSLSVVSDYDVMAARQKGKLFAEQIGFVGSMPALLAALISELARDLALSSKRGRIIIQSIQSGPRRGIAIIVSETSMAGQNLANNTASLISDGEQPKLLSEDISTTQFPSAKQQESGENARTHLNISQRQSAQRVYRAIIDRRITDEVKMMCASNGGAIVKVVKWM
jgi:hypothetical protein